MKKIFTKLMLWAVVATALVSCENNFEDATINGGELTQTVTLSANKPTEVRTELIEGVPYWSKGDQIGVYTTQAKDADNYAFANDNNEATLTTSFTGTTAVANTLFVYYPYTNFSNPVTEKGVKVEILANQEPTAASFDGRTDLMIAKPVTLDAEGKQLSDLEFARVAAIVKIVLKDKTGNLAGQHVSSLTMTAATNLVGRLYLDVVNQEIFTGEGGGLYYGGAKSVNATYTEATQYEVNGENATYVVVYPQTLATGSKLSFEASTEGYAISKEITLPSDIELLAGKVTTLNVSLTAENVVKEEAGLALPFKDDFARVAYDASEGGIDLSVLGENYSAMDKVYKAKVGNGGVLKLGTSSVEGYFTTVALDLSKPFTVFVEAQRYGSSTSDKLQITVGSQVLTSTNLTADSKYYIFEFEAASKKEQVEIRTIKRAYINDLQIVEGHGLDVPTLPAVLTVSTAEISGVSHEGEVKTFTYSVANPVEGVSATVTDNADWITTADNNGTVTVTVAANEAEEAREGVVTVTYGDLTETVTVKQNAKPAEGGAQTAQYVKVTSTSDITSGTYLIVYESKSYAFNGGLATASIDAAGNYKSVIISNNTIESNATTDALAFVYDATNKSFKGVGGAYIGRTATSNGMDESSTTVRTHSSVTISNGNAIITSSGGPNLQFYDSGSNSRFRYYSTSQKAIQLYKLVSGSSEGGEGGSTPEPDQPGTGGGDSAEPVTVTMSTFSSTSASMDSVISYTTAKGGGTSDPAINGSVIRLYQNSAGTGGGYITITAASGHKISSVTIGSSMATKVAYTVDGGTTKSASSSLAANGKYTVTEDAQSITIHCMGKTSSERLYVNYLSVTYK